MDSEYIAIIINGLLLLAPIWGPYLLYCIVKWAVKDAIKETVKKEYLKEGRDNKNGNV